MDYKQQAKTNNQAFVQTIENTMQARVKIHTYLLYNMQSGDIEAELNYLIQTLITRPNEPLRDPLTYADLITIDGASQEITKDLVLEAIGALQKSALDAAGVKILVLKMVENGNPFALNALLKMIEEPTPSVYIIMTCMSLAKVIKTIVSRAQVIYLKSQPGVLNTALLVKQGLEAPKAAWLVKVLGSAASNLTLTAAQQSLDLFDAIQKALALVLKNPSRIFAELASLFDKTNHLVSLRFLTWFWKAIPNPDEHQGSKGVLPSLAKLLAEYQRQTLQLAKALVALDGFEQALKNKVNFELAKSTLLIKLEQCYG